MPVFPVTMYAAKCDHCGEEWSDDAVIAYTDKVSMEEAIGNSNWKKGDGKEGEKGKCYCDDCWYYDDEDKFCLVESRKNIKV